MKTKLVPFLTFLLIWMMISCASVKKAVPGQIMGISTEKNQINMISVAPMRFPTGTDDNGEEEVPYAFYLGETEVTFDLWFEVFAWATSEERSTQRYYFQNQGLKGDGKNTDGDKPVTSVNWNDSLVWCNAFTEYFNEISGESLECVYTDKGQVIRDSRNDNSEVCRLAQINLSAKGFRLPEQNEWILGGRWSGKDINSVPGYDNPWFTAGSSASGAEAKVDDVTISSQYAVFGADSPQSVKSKLPNDLGLYDMSGNVCEWTTGLSSDYYRICKGGSWAGVARSVKIGYVNGVSTQNATSIIGFRLAKTL